MDPLQYVRASPQSIPDEHLNPSSEVVRLVHAPAGETIGEGYTCTVHLPSSLPPEDVGMVNLAGQRPSSHSSTAASARASITLGSFALRVTKKGHQADVNRDINRCGRLPEVAILPTILAWDPDQGRVLMPRLYPVPLDLVGSKQVVRLIGDMRMALSILHDHHIIHGDVRLANIMVRLDPPSFVLIDYGGCLESLWPVKQGYMVEGKGGAQHRPPAECTTRPFVCLRSDYYRLGHTVVDEILPSLILLEDSSGHRPEAEGGTAPRRRRRLDMRAKLPSTVMSEIDDWLRTNDWATVCNPPTLFPPGSWRQTAVDPVICLTAHLWTSQGRSRFCTTHFYTGLERKGNSEGRFVEEEPRAPDVYAGNTGSWEKSAFSPRIFLICELRTRHRTTLPVAQEVFPWLSYANDNGRLVHESPPAAPAPSTAADTATPRVAAPPTRRTEVTPHIRLPRSFAEAPPPRGIWSDPAPEPEPTPGANATPAALPQPYFADERMLDMVHSLQLHQGLAMLTASTANPDQGIARALLLNSLNETLEFLDNLRTYVEDME